MKLRFVNLQAQLDGRGITQAELAFAAGVSLASVNRAVRGELVTPPVFGKIMRALGSIKRVSRNGRASGTLEALTPSVAGPRRPSVAK